MFVFPGIVASCPICCRSLTLLQKSSRLACAILGVFQAPPHEPCTFYDCLRFVLVSACCRWPPPQELCTHPSRKRLASRSQSSTPCTRILGLRPALGNIRPRSSTHCCVSFLFSLCAVLISFPTCLQRAAGFLSSSSANHLTPKRTVDVGPGTIGQFVLRRSTGLAFTFMAILRAEPRSVADSFFL